MKPLMTGKENSVNRFGEGREAVQALRELSDARGELGCDDEALKLYEEAVGICRDVGDPLLLAHTIRHLGQFHHDAGRVEDAERRYVQALGIYRAHANPPPLDLANAIRPLAILKEQIGEPNAAKRMWEEARELYEISGVQAGVDECSDRLARLNSAPP